MWYIGWSDRHSALSAQSKIDGRCGKGGRDWIVYHCSRKPDAQGDRYVRAQPFTWTGDVPDFGSPLPPIDRPH